MSATQKTSKKITEKANSALSMLAALAMVHPGTLAAEEKPESYVKPQAASVTVPHADSDSAALFVQKNGQLIKDGVKQLKSAGYNELSDTEFRIEANRLRSRLDIKSQFADLLKEREKIDGVVDPNSNLGKKHLSRENDRLSVLAYTAIDILSMRSAADSPEKISSVEVLPALFGQALQAITSNRANFFGAEYEKLYTADAKLRPILRDEAFLSVVNNLLNKGQISEVQQAFIRSAYSSEDPADAEHLVRISIIGEVLKPQADK